ELFAGPSEPARLLRALVDPAYLRPIFELETVRRVRTASAQAAGGDTIRFAFDSVTVRKGDVSGDLDELEVSVAAGMDGAIEGLVELIEHGFGVRFTLADTAARARHLIDEMRMQRLEQDVRAAREVAVVAYDDGRISLCREDTRRVLPTGPGSAQDACRRVLRNVFGKAHGRIRLLGISAGREARPALEVWLAEDVAASESRCVWLPLDVVLEQV